MNVYWASLLYQHSISCQEEKQRSQNSLLDPQEVFHFFEWRLVAYSKTGKPKQARSNYLKCKPSSKKMAVFFVASNRILEKLAETQREYSVYRQNWVVFGLASERPEDLSDSPNDLFISFSPPYLLLYELPKHNLLRVPRCFPESPRPTCLFVR